VITDENGNVVERDSGACPPAGGAGPEERLGQAALPGRGGRPGGQHHQPDDAGLHRSGGTCRRRPRAPQRARLRPGDRVISEPNPDNLLNSGVHNLFSLEYNQLIKVGGYFRYGNLLLPPNIFK
jgi:hypothetical protein